MTIISRAAVSALALAFAHVPAAAQDTRDLDNASSDVRVFQGQITTGAETYGVTVPAGSALAIVAAPAVDSLLDPFLRVRDAATGEVLAEDDDGGGSLAARAFVFAETERRITMEVSGEGAISDERKTGGFELSLRPTDWRPTPPREVSFSEVVNGRLQPGEKHVFYIQARAGQTLSAVLRSGESSALDPYLELRRGRSENGAIVVEDDDSGGSLNARVTHQVRTAGTYTIVARGLGSSAGDYALQLGDGSETAGRPAVQEISLGKRMTGTIGTGVGPSGEDRSEVAYRLSADAKRALRGYEGSIVIRFRNANEDSGLDPVIDFGIDTPLGTAVLDSDDDSGGALNSELTVDLSPLAAEPDWLDRLRFVGRSLNSAEGEYAIEIEKAD